MLRRYLILSGCCEKILPAIDDICVRTGLSVAFQDANVIVVASADLPVVPLNDQRGVILGDMFADEPPFIPVRALSSATQSMIGDEDSGSARRLGVWGHFIAVRTADVGNRHIVYRPPFGSLAAYYSTTLGGTAIASDIGLLRELGPLAIETDWRSIARHLIAPNLRSEKTCLLGVSELAGGTVLNVTRGRPETRKAWSPWWFTRRDDHLTDEAAAVASLREYVDGCVRTLAGSTDHAVLGVSGGLDSSIVAAALAQSGTPFSCLTLYTRDPAGDERRYARLLASRLGVKLSETMEEISNVDITRSDAGHLPRPIARSFAQSGDRGNVALADEVGANSYFSGGGGDNVFCYLQSAAPVTDCLLTRQFGNALQTARDISQVADCSTWTALRSGVRRAFEGRRTYLWRPELTFLTRDAASEPEMACTPQWPDAPPDTLPGKATHVAWLVGILNHLEGYGRERTRRTVWPLMSLPIVELCLRIPSWMWSRGGQNRALARRAYADILPREILERRSKGTPDCFVVELFEANRQRIREFLCEGLLASNDIVDREQIASFLAADGPVRGLGYWRIMTLTDVEAWIQTVSQGHRAY